ncbi:hypothetical protein ACLOJK_034347, partial [Asimina triloba]
LGGPPVGDGDEGAMANSLLDLECLECCPFMTLLDIKHNLEIFVPITFCMLPIIHAFTLYADHGAHALYALKLEFLIPSSRDCIWLEAMILFDAMD